MNYIGKLKVFKFENGEEECVIAQDYQEAYAYYKDIVDEDIEDFNITQIKDWFNIKVKCEVHEKQEDGTYFKMRTMADIANEIYRNKYTGPEIISTTVVY
jgi:hypothetical protein